MRRVLDGERAEISVGGGDGDDARNERGDGAVARTAERGDDGDDWVWIATVVAVV